MEPSLEKVASRDNIDKKNRLSVPPHDIDFPKNKTHSYILIRFFLDSFMTTKLVGSHKIKQIEQNPDDISIHLSSFIHQESKFSTKFQNPNTIYKKM